MRVLHAEAYVLLGAGLSALSLWLGGRMAGLPSPARAALPLWGGLGGLSALLPCLRPAWAAPALLLLPAGVVGCYHAHGWPACVRATLTTLCAALLLGGAGTRLRRLGMSARLALPLSAGLCAFLGLLLRLLPTAMTEVRQVELAHQGRAVLLPAMLDTGNLLRDPVTGRPVLVVSARALRPLFPGARSLNELTSLPPGFRLLSVKTAAGGALLPMFRPDRCRLYINGRAADADAMVAVAPESYGGVQALVPSAAAPAS